MGKTIHHTSKGTRITRTYRDKNGTRHVYSYKRGIIGDCLSLFWWLLKLPFVICFYPFIWLIKKF